MRFSIVVFVWLLFKCLCSPGDTISNIKLGPESDSNVTRSTTPPATERESSKAPASKTTAANQEGSGTTSSSPPLPTTTTVETTTSVHASKTTPANQEGSGTTSISPPTTTTAVETTTSVPASKTTAANQEGSGTTSSSPPPPTTTMVETTTSVPDVFCEDFRMSPSDTTSFYPSETATVSCTCTSKKDIVICPQLKMHQEANESIYFEKTTFQNQTNCTSTWTLGALNDKFTHRRVEAPLYCTAENDSRMLQVIIIFQKKGNGESCKEDMDCWSVDQACKDQKDKSQQCDCFPDQPVFVEQENQCYTAVSYEHHCTFDEQCMFGNPNAICQKNLCKCRENYWTKNRTDFTCITSDVAPMWNPYHIATVSTAILAMVLLVTHLSQV